MAPCRRGDVGLLLADYLVRTMNLPAPDPDGDGVSVSLYLVLSFSCAADRLVLRAMAWFASIGAAGRHGEERRARSPKRTEEPNAQRRGRLRRGTRYGPMPEAIAAGHC
jgi:hypothetical protein